MRTNQALYILAGAYALKETGYLTKRMGCILVRQGYAIQVEGKKPNKLAYEITRAGADVIGYAHLFQEDAPQGSEIEALKARLEMSNSNYESACQTIYNIVAESGCADMRDVLDTLKSLKAENQKLWAVLTGIRDETVSNSTAGRIVKVIRVMAAEALGGLSDTTNEGLDN